MHIKRISVAFVIAFAIVLLVLNFGVIKQYVWFAGTTISDDDDTPIYPARELLEPALLPVVQAQSFINVVPLPSQATLVIPKLGVDAPLIFDVPNNNDQIFDALKDGVVIHPVTTKPGEKGLSIALGHSSAPVGHNRYGNVFTLLSKLNPGDRFYVEYVDGRRFDYEIEEEFKFNPFDADDPYLYRLDGIDYNALTLVTCWPPGTDIQRQAVLAREI